MTNVGKAYKVFGSPFGILLDAAGLTRLTSYREFWAIRGFDLELYRGQRIGLIGRNGAGKSTLLKLVTQNFRPTEGDVEVNGEVHALFEAAGGLHPEFSGYENIRGSLEALGLDAAAIRDAEREIADFTELGRFLEQPFKTYSLGMQSRLSFAIATQIEPDILIVDEVLGAGDAYFFGKAVARMRRLVESGAAVLIVSHALDQVVRFCEETIWLDRGRVVMRGPSTEVVKAYEKFIRELEDRRLRARNRKSLQLFDAFEREGFTDELELHVTGDCDLGRITLLRDGEPEDELVVGAAQDSDDSQSSYVALEQGGWGAPQQDGHGFYRPLDVGAEATAVFALWFFYPQSHYSVELAYRSRGGGVQVRLGRGATTLADEELGPADDWCTERIHVAGASATVGDAATAGLSRWPGAHGLLMDRVRMVDAGGQERALFRVGHRVSVVVDAVAEAAGRFSLIPAALIFRADGIIVTRHVGDELELDLDEGDRIEARLDLGPLQLGNGTYLLSVGLYKELDVNNTLSSEIYDYFDRSFEFTVAGNPPLHDEVFRHPGEWTVAIDSRGRTLHAEQSADG
jgi:lipopolysaccharide transport system ATP-binding protein